MSTIDHQDRMTATTSFLQDSNYWLWISAGLVNLAIFIAVPTYFYRRHVWKRRWGLLGEYPDCFRSWDSVLPLLVRDMDVEIKLTPKGSAGNHYRATLTYDGKPQSIWLQPGRFNIGKFKVGIFGRLRPQ